jgi:hypothetical protein
MSIIRIHDLGPDGLDLFQDSEGFMDSLNDDEMKAVNGGLTFSFSNSVSLSNSVSNSNSFSNSNSISNSNTFTNTNTRGRR